ncbi:RNA helicase [Sarracenia purpurea var. burkii]
MIKKRAIKTKAVRLRVLDECDEILSQVSVKEKIHELYGFLSHKHLQYYVRILVKRDEFLEGIHQFFIAVKKEDIKFETLQDETLSISRANIFCNTKKKVN